MKIFIKKIIFLLLFHLELQLGLCHINSTSTKELFIDKEKVVNSTFLALLEYKLSTCIISKNFSTMLTSIFCYLFMEKKFKLKYNHLADFNWKFSKCIRQIKHKSLGELINNLNYHNKDDFSKNWILLLIVRNPIERFISGYVDKCTQRIRLKKRTKMCLYCVSNIECFINRLYKIINSPIKIKRVTYNGVKKHFFPQIMQCDYYKHKNKFKILKYDSKKLNNFYSEFEEILASRNISKNDIKFMDKELKNFRVHHATSNKSSTNELTLRLYKNKRLMNKLFNIYHRDFIEFNFPYPEVV
uniref:Carbohydrate sulfotransferase n=1 Tax=Strongyloides venezuelensis TaxID=75913 RepID=A0A0K0FA96_STRVS